MTKRELFRILDDHATGGLVFSVRIADPSHYHQVTRLVELRANSPCFGDPTRHSGLSARKTIDTAISSKTANAKAERYQRWVNEFAKRGG